MALNTRVIKTKIRSVKSTRKITKAMEMIAAAKMRKAVEAANITKSYTEMVTDMMGKVSGQANIKHELLNVRKVRKELVILTSSSRGLCGNYNGAVLAKAQKYIHKTIEEAPEIKIDVIAVGKKASVFARRQELNLIESYDKVPEDIKLEDILPLIGTALNGFKDKSYDKVTMVFTQFQSSLSQKPKVAQVLPISTDMIKPELPDEAENEIEKEVENKEEMTQMIESEKEPEDEYTVEPNPVQVINFALNRVLESQIYQAFLEAAASEHSSRMVAMKSASDAADDMIGNLTLEYNKSRQAAITQEIAEISNAANAMA